MKRMRKVILFMVIYVSIFWIGFKFGEVHVRDTNSVKLREIMPPKPQLYYVVEKVNFGDYRRTQIETMTDANLIIRLFKNEKLKHLLKLLDVQIYTEKGERLY